MWAIFNNLVIFFLNFLSLILFYFNNILTLGWRGVKKKKKGKRWLSKLSAGISEDGV